MASPDAPPAATGDGPADEPRGGAREAARLAAVDAALSSESLLPLPLDLVSRVIASVEREPAHAASAPARAPRARRFAWRIAAAAGVAALGAHLAFEPDALASAESLATLRLPAAEAATAPLAGVVRASREGLVAVAADVPAYGSLDAVADAGDDVSLGTAALLAGGAALVAAGIGVAIASRLRGPRVATALPSADPPR